MSRVLPEELSVGEGRQPIARERDGEALHYWVSGPLAELPESLDVVSEDAAGRYRDLLQELRLTRAVCPRAIEAPGRACKVSPALRIVGDAIDRSHPHVVDRSIRGEVGGQLRFFVESVERYRIPIGAPRALESGGPGRYRARLRAHVVRMTRGGAPAVGEDDAEARALAIQEIQLATSIWGQCGVHFGLPEELEVRVVDPPAPKTWLQIGCGETLPASGGELLLRVGPSIVRLKTSQGQSPEAVAARLSASLEERGYQVERFLNPPLEHLALPSVDLRAKNQQGVPLTIDSLERGELSTDPTLRVCPLSVDLEDGLTHFTDGDSASGTSEERALIRSLVDGDPRTIDWILVPFFSGLGRIGESFIASPGASIQNVILLDRSGMRASARSFTLAHELGHILLDMPGHPDDYGVDLPQSLMDADASDGTIFGPRRLSLPECRRMLRQSGPHAPTPLLEAWPLSSLPRPDTSE